MPVIQRSISLAAGAINENAVSGSQYEFARRRCLISGGILASAGGVLANVSSGGDVVMEQFPVATGAGFPIIPDNMVFNDVMEAGDRLSIPLQNTTAGPLNVQILIQIQDL